MGFQPELKLTVTSQPVKSVRRRKKEVMTGNKSSGGAIFLQLFFFFFHTVTVCEIMHTGTLTAS